MSFYFLFDRLLEYWNIPHQSQTKHKVAYFLISGFVLSAFSHELSKKYFLHSQF